MQLASVFDEFVQSLIFTKLHEHVNIISILKKVFEIYDILVIQLFMYLNFLTQFFRCFFP